jgi:hypothetical protein
MEGVVVSAKKAGSIMMECHPLASEYNDKSGKCS